MCPGWVLRRPKQFLEELLERLVKLMNGGNNQEMELVTQVRQCLFLNHFDNKIADVHSIAKQLIFKYHLLCS